MVLAVYAKRYLAEDKEVGRAHEVGVAALNEGLPVSDGMGCTLSWL